MKIPWYNPMLRLPVHSAGIWWRRLDAYEDPIPGYWLLNRVSFFSAMVSLTVPGYGVASWRALSSPPAILITANWYQLGQLLLAFQRQLTGTVNVSHCSLKVNSTPIVMSSLTWSSGTDCQLTPIFTPPSRTHSDLIEFSYDGLDASFTWSDLTRVPAFDLKVIASGV